MPVDTLEAMADSIEAVKKAIEKIDNSLVSERLIQIILKHENNIPMSTTREVFRGLRNLDKFIKVTGDQKKC